METFQLTTLNTSGMHQLPESATCLSLSEDGFYLSIGHARGLSIWSATSFSCVAEWSQDRIEITSIQMTKVAEKTYLLGTIDDMETWFKELGSVLSLTQDPSSSIMSEMQWMPSAMIHKIKPLHCASDTLSESSSQFNSHFLALDEKCSTAGSTVHFLLPLSDGRKENTDLPNAFCVWWSGCKHLLQYNLQKETKHKSDSQSLPAVLWPNTNKIVCSAVSGCTRYIALGFSDTVVCVWDRNFGSPLSILTMSDVDSPFSEIDFMDCCPGSRDDSNNCRDTKLLLLLKCKSGELYTFINVGQGREFRMLQLAERVKDSGDLSIVTAAVPFLQDLVFIIQRNGKMYLQDIINKTNVCSLILPPKYVLASSCKPVFALNGQHHTLLIQGVKDPLSTEDSHSQLHIFCFGECDIVKPYIITPSKKEQTCYFDTLQGLCNQYLQDRKLSRHKRTKGIRKTWMKLQETPRMIK
ncbi:hypothetical protein WMY93_013847 [Mugilogobius chulae]|uniref:Uncharacterized protein n=1 Tax=Mugilogobius chulae TaxID=88201 RepID=A0AAW0PDI5_9GOBI